MYVMLFLFGSSALAQEQTGPDIESRAYLIDPNGKLTVDEVMARPVDDFAQFNKGLRLGYTAATVWMRLKISPIALGDSPGFGSSDVVLMLKNPLLNDVRLYDPLQNNGRPIMAGDLYPLTQIERDLSPVTFILPLGDRPRDVYVSVKSTGSMMFGVTLEPLESALKNNRTSDLVSGLYLGLLAMFLIFAIGLRFGFPDFLINLFIVQQATAIIWSLVLMGYARQYSDLWFGLDSFDRPANWIMIVYGFLLCLFRLAFLSQFPFRGRTKLLIYVPLCIYVPIFTLMALGYDSWALGINVLTVTVAAVLSMLLVLFAVDWNSYTIHIVPRWLVTFFFVFSGFATPLATSVVLWGEQALQDPLSPLLFIAVASGVLMSTILFYRARSMANHLMASQLESKLLLQRRQEQAKFLGMLAHEIKTPLSILSWVASSGQLDNRYTTYSQQAISNIDSVLEKCLQAESMIDNEVVSQAVLLDVESLVHDVVTGLGGTDIFEISCTGEMKTFSDPALVRVVLTNLVENALKYGKCDVPIKVSLISDSRQIIRVRVTNAIGRAGAPDVNRVFEKYYRGSLASSEPGSGLGLYLSKHISKSLGGDLICQLGEKEIWFEFSLPLST